MDCMDQKKEPCYWKADDFLMDWSTEPQTTKEFENLTETSKTSKESSMGIHSTCMQPDCNLHTDANQNWHYSHRETEEQSP
mmetsp:Transcript_9805/g.22601  ORF Transcript_9805/g.22601 Transcript_9805/m.22601 type:complete len:81 (-) Transcript_9805:146-388(-)